MLAYNEKRNKLIKLLNTALKSQYGSEIQFLQQAFEITDRQLEKAFLDYNLDINVNICNSIYESLSNRLVLHIHNLILGSWHQDRQQTMCKLVDKADVQTVVDIGYGVPSSYMFNFLSLNPNNKLFLADLYQSAFAFSKALFDHRNNQTKKQISYITTDMNSLDYVGDFDLYIFQDSIEHIENSFEYLKRYIEKSPSHSQFLLSLPIGPIFERHYIAWASDSDGKKWLENSGLIVKNVKNVYVKPAVDLFAEQLIPTYHDMYALCAKA